MLSLCPKCFEAAEKRINAAIEHNPDRDVDWWVKWWDKECERQLRHMKDHCEGHK